MNEEEDMELVKGEVIKEEANIMVYILPTAEFTHYVGEVRRYKVGTEGVNIGKEEDMQKNGYKLAKNCYIVFPAYHMQALYHPPSILAIDEAHPFVWIKEGEEGIYVDDEGLVTL